MNKWKDAKVKRRKVSSEVSERIEKMIVSGNLSLGESLPSERELTELLGVGRTSVREALFALSRKGLVTISPGERPRVTNPSASHVLDEVSGVAKYLLTTDEGARQFQDARKLFECAIARRAAKIATKEQIFELRKALDANLAATSTGELVSTDMAFHYAIAVLSGNRMLTAVCDAMSDWLAEQRTRTLQVPNSAERAKREHKRIFAAIADRDADAAEKAMEDHLNAVAAVYAKAKKQRTSN